MSRALGAMVARHVQLASLGSSHLAALRGAPTRLRPHAQVVRPISASGATWEGDGRKLNVYTDFVIYKTRGAMSLRVIKPTWERVPSGSGISIIRDGTILLEFANARGPRDYDWENKEKFALSAVECAEIMLAVENGAPKDFFHDPNKLGTAEGTLTKSLRINPNQDSSYFFNLSVNNKIAGSQIKYDIVVSPAELRIIRRIMDFCIPKLLGFNEVFEGPPEIRENMPSAPAAGSQPPF